MARKDEFTAYEVSFHLGRAYGWGRLSKPQRLTVILQAFAILWPENVPVNVVIGKGWK